MNANGAALLANPHPCGHIVYPYTDENLVGQAACLFASAGLHAGEGVILIMTEAHYQPIRLRLQVEGFNVESYERSGQLICAHAEKLIARFMSEGMLNSELFKSTIGDFIRRVRTSMSNSHPARVRAFGEMVSLLRHTNLGAATQMEELWNDVIQEHSISLLCSYSMLHTHDQIEETLKALHTHNIDAERSAGR